MFCLSNSLGIMIWATVTIFSDYIYRAIVAIFTPKRVGNLNVAEPRYLYYNN